MSYFEVRFSVDGRPGNNGRNGSNGSNGYYSGQRGSNGGNATPSTPGQDAGEMEVILSRVDEGTEPNSEDAYVAEVLKRPAGSAEYLDTERRALEHFTDITLSAVGGKGGDGGRGGNGGNGARGRSGTGSGNGGSGGNGGDAGSGSSGSRGGNGGIVTVTVGAEDLYLLMAIPELLNPSEIVKGGAGGRAGAHGSPGSGGSGGRGGSGDSDGRRGSSGPSGRRGREASGFLSSASGGTPGSLSIVMTDGSSALAYNRPYNLQFGGMLAGSDEGLSDTEIVFQFGDTIDIVKICSDNVGPMISPSQPTEIKIRANKFISPVASKTAFINNQVLADQQTEADGGLQFFIPVPDMRKRWADTEPYFIETKLYLDAWQLGPRGFSRRYNGFHRDGMEMKLKFPVENLLGFQGLSSIQGGYATRVSFAIKNCSLKDLGASSESGRKLYVQIYQHKSPEFDIVQENYRLSFEGRNCESLQPNDTNAIFQGETFPIDFLEKGETKELVGSLFLSPQNMPYSRIALQAEIVLEDLPRPGDPEAIRGFSVIQRRQLKVVVEPTYYPADRNDAVLVTSSVTTKEEFQFWKDMLTQRLGLAIGYFSVSIYGSLSPEYQLASGLSLAQAFKNKLIIVLDKEFNPLHDGVSALNPSSLLPNGCLSQTSGFDESTRWLLVSPPEVVVKQHLSAHYTAPPSDANTYSSAKEFFAAQQERLDHDRSNGRTDDLEIREDTIIKETKSAMKDKYLRAKAKKVAHWMREKDGMRQCIVEWKAGERDPETKKFANRIVVRRGYFRGSNSTHVFPRSLADATEILGGCTVLAVAKALPYPTLIQTFSRCARSDDTEGVAICLDAVVDEFLWDLSNFLDSKLVVTDDCVVDNFPSLAFLLNSDEMARLSQTNSEGATDAVSKLIARLECIAKSKDLRPWWNPRSRKYELQEHLVNFVAILRGDWKAATSDATIDAEKKAIETQVMRFLRKRSTLFATSRRASHWRKGISYVFSIQNRDRKEYGPPSTRKGTYRILEMESPGYDQKLLPIRLLKTFKSNAECEVLRAGNDLRQRMSAELLQAVTDTRAQNEHAVIEDVEVVYDA